MNNTYFIITTNKETAEKIVAQCKRDERYGLERSYRLGYVTHNNGYSDVQIIGKEGQPIKPKDIFWLGHYSVT